MVRYYKSTRFIYKKDGDKLYYNSHKSGGWVLVARDIMPFWSEISESDAFLEII